MVWIRSQRESLDWLDIYRSFDEELSLISGKSCHWLLDFLVSTYIPNVLKATYGLRIQLSVHPVAT
jgi:hypothetical protein